MALSIPPMVLMGVRAFQLICSLIVLGTGAYVCHFFNADTIFSPPDSAAFIVFCAVWSILALAYLTFSTRLHSESGRFHFFPLVVDALTMLFWFAGFIALATWTSDHCGSGSACRNSAAAASFGAFAWAAFAVTTFFLAFGVFSRRPATTTPTTTTHQPPVAEVGTDKKVGDGIV